MSQAEFPIPCTLRAAASQEGREDWLATVPHLLRRFADEWSLTVGAPFQPGGHTAWVAPAHTAQGASRVLKIAWRHPEADHEPDGLRVWAGDAAVRLYADAEFTDTIVLLLERCHPGDALSGRPEPEQDVVIAGLLRRLWVEPPEGHRFRRLADMCARWADQFEMSRAAGRMLLDPSLAAEGIGLFRSLPTTAHRNVLLCTDLHAGNVLAAQREPWLMIDPKPYLGDPTYDAVQHILNCADRLHRDPHGLAARLADLLDLDRDRLLLWLFARCVQESPDWPQLGDIARRLAPT